METWKARQEINRRDELIRRLEEEQRDLREAMERQGIELNNMKFMARAWEMSHGAVKTKRNVMEAHLRVIQDESKLLIALLGRMHAAIDGAGKPFERISFTPDIWGGVLDQAELLDATLLTTTEGIPQISEYMHD